MICVDPGHAYYFHLPCKPDQFCGFTLLFRKRMPNGVVTEGVTTCDILNMLIHRIESLDKQNPCIENVATLHGLRAALAAQQARAARIQEEKSPVQTQGESHGQS